MSTSDRRVGVAQVADFSAFMGEDGRCAVVAGKRMRRFKSRDGRAMLYVLGEVVGGDDALLEAYASSPASFPARVDGSFLVVVTTDDERVVRAVTDRTGSRRLYVGPGPSLSTDLYALGRSLDTASLGCYLASGVPLVERSIVSGVSWLPGGTDAIVRPEGIESRTYWRFTLTPESGDEGELASELGRLVEQAVARRVRPGRSSLLSLSAGVDSRGILGVLRFRLGVEDLQTFSYSTGIPRPGTDPSRARELAARAGYPHRVVESYGGDLLEAIAVNVRLGRGTTYYCDESSSMGSPQRDRRTGDRRR